MVAKFDGEQYSLLHLTWDVSELWRRIDNDRVLHTIDVEPLYNTWLKHIDQNTNQIYLGGVALVSRVEGVTGKAYAMSDAIDLTVPLLASEVYNPDKPEQPDHMIIDGWSRVYKAYHTGVATLQVYLITLDELTPDVHYNPVHNHAKALAKLKPLISETAIKLLLKAGLLDKTLRAYGEGGSEVYDLYAEFMAHLADFGGIDVEQFDLDPIY